MDRDKKISFGFSKLSKKPPVIKNRQPEREKVELVECLEGQSIKIKDAPELTNEPLVIPIKDNKKNLLDRIKDAKAKQKQLNNKEAEQEDNRPESELTIDEQAVRELVNDAKNRLSNTESTKKIFTLPIRDDIPTFNGEPEPTLDDYEKVPVGDYGMAMLRGMGWKEGMGIGRNVTKIQPTNLPELRPKGLGLGASRMVKTEISKESVCDEDGNMLIIKKGTYAKIIAGSHKGKYCEVQGLDDEAGRVIVRTSLTGEILTLNEFLIVPITKEEYRKGSKVLNNAKFEEYKDTSNNNFENNLKQKSTSKVVTEGHSSRGYKKENELYEKSRKHDSKREFKEETHKYGKDKHHSRSKSQNSYMGKDRSSFNSSSENDSEEEKCDKKDQKNHRDRSKFYSDKYKSKQKHERKSPPDHQKYTSRKSKSKGKHERSSSESDSDYRKSRR